MHSANDRQWRDYCKALNLNPYDLSLKRDDYYLRGFEEWKKLNKEYSYYKYQSYVLWNG